VSAHAPNGVSATAPIVATAASVLIVVLMFIGLLLFLCWLKLSLLPFTGIGKQAGKI
jgi:hypothetical protein